MTEHPVATKNITLCGKQYGPRDALDLGDWAALSIHKRDVLISARHVRLVPSDTDATPKRKRG